MLVLRQEFGALGVSKKLANVCHDEVENFQIKNKIHVLPSYLFLRFKRRYVKRLHLLLLTSGHGGVKKFSSTFVAGSCASVYQRTNTCSSGICS